MADFENITAVDAPPQVLFDYLADLADLAHLPEYVARMHRATPIDGGEAVHSVAESSDGHVVEGETWCGVDRAAMRMAWGSEGSEGSRGYRGELAVLDGDDDGDGGSRLWVRLSLARVDGAEEVQRRVDDTVAAVRARVEAAVTTRS